jgi:hypothetical protein
MAGRATGLSDGGVIVQVDLQCVVEFGRELDEDLQVIEHAAFACVCDGKLGRVVGGDPHFGVVAGDLEVDGVGVAGGVAEVAGVQLDRVFGAEQDGAEREVVSAELDEAGLAVDWALIDGDLDRESSAEHWATVLL